MKHPTLRQLNTAGQRIGMSFQADEKPKSIYVARAGDTAQIRELLVRLVELDKRLRAMQSDLISSTGEPSWSHLDPGAIESALDEHRGITELQRQRELLVDEIADAREDAKLMAEVAARTRPR